MLKKDPHHSTCGKNIRKNSPFQKVQRLHTSDNLRQQSGGFAMSVKLMTFCSDSLIHFITHIWLMYHTSHIPSQCEWCRFQHFGKPPRPCND